MRRLTDRPATLLLAGADYRRTPAPRREALARLAAGFHQWISERRPGAIAEGFALSTCHRVEFYVAARDVAAAVDELRAHARAVTGDDALAPQEPLTRASDAPAIRHLCRVTCGLESMVLGEHEISGQVRRAALDARTVGSAGPTLTAVIAAALSCSSRVRTETQLGQGSASLASVAVQSLVREVDLSRARVLLIGAGMVAREAARRLMRHRPASVAIASRSHEHARSLAAEVKGETVEPCALTAALAHHDVCIAAITATAPAIALKDLAGLRDFRAQPLFIADLSLPRAFDSAVVTVPGIRRFTVDDLGIAADAVRARRLKAVPAAEAIVDEETRRALARLHAMGSRVIREAVA